MDFQSGFFSTELGPRFSVRENVFGKFYSLENILREWIFREDLFYTIRPCGAEEEARRGRRLGLQPDLVTHSVAGALVALCKGIRFRA